MEFERISVIGLGYIGLPTAAMFASHGVNVLGVDVSLEVTSVINRGDIHIFEPGLAEMVSNAVKLGRLTATVTPEPADAFLITVPTPFFKNEAGEPRPDLSHINAACEAIAPVLASGNLVVLESTSPVGTTELVKQWLSELRPDLRFPDGECDDHDVCIAYCPERVLPGGIIRELVENERVVGGLSNGCSKMAGRLYGIFVRGDCHLTDARTAEMCKLAENASRDVQIAFANELSVVCELHGINIWSLIDFCNRHPRVNILQPGPGVGGHCIAVDPWFIVSGAPHVTSLMQTARKVNLSKEAWVIQKVQEYLKKTDCERIVIFGVAFKENIDDFRESPGLRIAKELHEILVGKVVIIEPNYEDLELAGMQVIGIEDFDANHDLCVLLVSHTEFAEMSKPKHLIDIKGVWR